jgi:hypothetical protein
MVICPARVRVNAVPLGGIDTLIATRVIDIHSQEKYLAEHPAANYGVD